MRAGPLFLGFLISTWFFLAVVGWAVTGVPPRRERNPWTIAVAVALGIGAGFAPVLVGLRGGLGLMLSFPLSLGASVLVSIALDKIGRVRAPSRSGLTVSGPEDESG